MLVPPFLATVDARQWQSAELLVVSNAYDAQSEGVRMFLTTVFTELRHRHPRIRLLVVGHIDDWLTEIPPGVVVAGSRVPGDVPRLGVVAADYQSPRPTSR